MIAIYDFMKKILRYIYMIYYTGGIFLRRIIYPYSTNCSITDELPANIRKGVLTNY